MSSNDVDSYIYVLRALKLDDRVAHLNYEIYKLYKDYDWPTPYLLAKLLRHVASFIISSSQRLVLTFKWFCSSSTRGDVEAEGGIDCRTAELEQDEIATKAQVEKSFRMSLEMSLSDQELLDSVMQEVHWWEDG